MEISCLSCGRYFDLDDALIGSAKAAKCLCGSRLRMVRDTDRQSVQRLGKYQLQRRIAVGGMGEIFYGKIAGIEGFEREVAIKKMLPHLSADRAFIDMMIKEAKLTVLLNHPNIVQVYDLAREGNEYYIAMEYVSGTNVGHLLEMCYTNGTRLPTEVAVYITMQVLRGLAYAHDLRDAAGEPMHILHRDITPQNILVTPSAWVKITDFGIAKARNEISTTSPGMIKGKLGYIAPEQLGGRAPDQRVDIFCAGILLWESLATRRLFKGQNEIDTFRLINEARVPQLSKFRNDVSPAIEKVLAKALAREPDDRYAAADDFYNELVEAIYPRTVDELARATRDYFAAHPEAFDNLVSASDRLPTTETPVPSETDTIPDSELPLVTDLMPRPRSFEPQLQAARHARTKRIWPFITVASLAIIIGIVAVAWTAIADRQAARETSSTPQQTPVMAAPGDPRLQPLTTPEVELALRGEYARIKECYCGSKADLKSVETIHATLSIASTGGVASAVLEPPIDKLGHAGSCVSHVLTSMLFRPTAISAFETTVALPAPKSIDCGSAPAQRDDEPRSSSERERPLTGPEIQQVVQRNSQAIATCLQRFDRARAPAKVDARLTIDQSGRVSDVTLAPAIEVPEVSRCLDKSLRGLRFHRQPTKDFRVTIPLKIQQVL